MMLKEESKKQLITRATQYGVDPFFYSQMMVKILLYGYMHKHLILSQARVCIL